MNLDHLPVDFVAVACRMVDERSAGKGRWVRVNLR
jgi:hypothetical protein